MIDAAYVNVQLSANKKTNFFQGLLKERNLYHDRYKTTAFLIKNSIWLVEGGGG